MQLIDYLGALRRRWLVIAVFAALGVMVAEGASLLATPQYSAQSVVYFSLPNGSSSIQLQAGSTYAQAQVESYAQLATTPQVLEPVIKKNSLTESSTTLANTLTVKVVQGTVMVSVTATDPSAARAAQIANAVTTSLGREVSSLSPRNAAGKASIEATVVTEAQVPKAPSSPKTTRNLLAGLVGGLLIGVVVALLRELTDTRVRGIEGVRKHTKAPIIGQLGSKLDLNHTRPGGGQDPGMEAIRRVRTNLSFLGVEERPLVVGVTSSMPSEGKSTIAVNVAAALGEAGQKVLLIDADLRRPAVARMTDLDDAVGLTTVLIGRVDMDDAVQTWGSTGVDVITAGEIPPNPGELLESRGMERLIENARSRYDVIVVDTTPLVPVAETAVLSRLLSGYVLVVRSGAVRDDDLSEAVSTLANVDGKIYGVVMNGLRERESSAYRYESPRSGPRPPSSPGSGSRSARHNGSLEKRVHPPSKTQRLLPGRAARVVD